MAAAATATILVVEDDPGTARLVRGRLERAGYAVETADAADEGMERIRRGGVDLVVLDQRLASGVSGLDLYERVKAEGFDVPAVLATGFGDETTLVRALRAGVRDFVPKTADYLNYLPPAVARVLQQVRTERELAESRARAREAVRRQQELEAEAAEKQRLLRELRSEVEQRKRYEEALREADRRKDDFLAVLGHELRNPLAPIRNGLEVLKLGPPAPAFAQTCSMIGRQVQVMARLVDDLLDVSRISRGKIELRKAPADLQAVAARAVETARPLIDARRHTLAVELPPEPLSLNADAVRLAQVLGNLLNNAAKYTEPGGKIWLTAGREGGEVVARVRDTGVGIAPDMRARVFEPFTQADHSPALTQGGLGIGLALAKRLVELHGGRIEVHSAGPGQGSEFVVRLPASPSPPAPLPQGERGDMKAPPPPTVRADMKAPLPSGERGGGEGEAPARPRVLVVDDNVDAAESLAVLLRHWGYEARTAHDGLAAVAAAREFAPDAALLDIGLPDMTGYELAGRLRAEGGLDGAALVAMTGFGQPADRQRSAEAGFRMHLVKPVDPAELRRLLAKFNGGNDQGGKP